MYRPPQNEGSLIRIVLDFSVGLDLSEVEGAVRLGRAMWLAEFSLTEPILVINLKTAKQIGLTIPPNVLARADRVIR